MSAADFFLKINGIEGESQDDQHKGEIEVLTWSWGQTQSGSSCGGGGSGEGKVTMKDFSFSMKVNKATPKLIQACAGGDHFTEATLTCRKAGGKQEEYLKYFFYDLIISSYETGASSGSGIIPIEHITFNYSKVEVEYKEQKAEGTVGGVIKKGYDLKKNIKIG